MRTTTRLRRPQHCVFLASSRMAGGSKHMPSARASMRITGQRHHNALHAKQTHKSAELLLPEHHDRHVPSARTQCVLRWAGAHAQRKAHINVAMHCIVQRCSHSDLQNMESLGDRLWGNSSDKPTHHSYANVRKHTGLWPGNLHSHFRGVGHVNNGAQSMAYMWACLTLTIKSWATCGRQ